MYLDLLINIEAHQKGSKGQQSHLKSLHSVIIYKYTVIINNQCIHETYGQSSRNTVNQLVNPFWSMVFWCFEVV